MSKLMRQLAEEGRRARQNAAKPKLGRSPAFVRYAFLDKDVMDVPVKSVDALRGSRSEFYSAAESIDNTMIWKETTEGVDFWEWVYTRLQYYGGQKP